MSLMTEFKEFAMKGSVVDLAVAVIIGSAFGKIVSSFVEDVLMPPIGMLMGGVDFKSLAITLKAAEGNIAAVTINYGKFTQTVIDFVIIAFVILMVVKAMSSMKRKEVTAPTPAPEPTKQEVLLTEIRDALRAK